MKNCLVPGCTFLLALALAGLAGPSRDAQSRAAAALTGCEPRCAITLNDDSAGAIASPRRRTNYNGNEEIVDSISAMTGNVGSVSVSSINWTLQVDSNPAGSQGGGGTVLRGTLTVDGERVQFNRVIAYGAGVLPGSHTVNGSVTATVRDLPKCKAVKGNLNWRIAAFAVYVSPNGANRAIGGIGDIDGWSCAAN